jgi:hypothetical protein
MGEVQTFRKKPAEIQAVQITGKETFGLLFDFLDGNEWMTNDAGGIDIVALEGTMTARQGDWIIRRVAGECYPCKPDIFAATYEQAHS